MACALLFQAKLLFFFFCGEEGGGECILPVGYLINRTPSFVLNRKAPFEVLFNKISSSHICSFGCLDYVYDNWVSKDKFHPGGRKCVFFGYSYGKKGWNFFYLDTRDFLCSQDIIFLENKLLFFC